MKMTEEQIIKLSNILQAKDIVSRQDDSVLPYTLRLSNAEEFGFEDFNFSYNGVTLRLFRGEKIWKCTDFISEEELLSVQPVFRKLKEVIIKTLLKGKENGETKTKTTDTIGK